MLISHPNPGHRLRLIAAARVSLLLALFLTGISARAFARQDNAQPVETGKFLLHKFQQNIGEEKYEVRRDGDALVMKTEFRFVHRSSRVPLETTLRTRQDLTPLSYEIKGKTSRLSEIDTAIEVSGKTAKIREGKESREAAAPDRFFTISGYAPVSVQMMMVRYWASKGVKGILKTLPGGDVTIERRGKDTIEVSGKRVE